MWGETMPMQARSRYYPRLTDAKLLLRLTACKSLSTEAQQRFSMGTVLTHPFLCLNRYRQNDRTTYIICYHSAPYSFTNKPEKGGWELTKPDTASNYARQPALINRLLTCHYILMPRLAVYPMHLM